MKHLPQLDGLRAIAVLMVIANHYYFPSSFLGYIGVDLFFVLSGFLITGILIRLKGVPLGSALKSFYARRALRIFPVFYLMLATLFVVGALRTNIPWAVFYVANFLIFSGRDFVGPNLGHIWSLCVEEQFYLVWPLVILLTPLRRLRAVMIGCIVFGFLFRAAAIWELHPLTFPARVLPLSALDAFAIGGILSLWNEQDWRRIKIIAMLCVVPLALLGPYGFDLVMALISAVLIGLTARSKLKFLEFKPLAYIGRISYCVYLIHWPMLLFVHNRPLAVAVTIATAAASWHLFESPINSLKGRFSHITTQTMGNTVVGGGGGAPATPTNLLNPVF